MGWLNDKVAPKHKAVCDKLDILLRHEKLDAMGISEANIWTADSNSDFAIRGYDIVVDSLYKEYGRAREALYINSQIRYDIRQEFVSTYFPEVWVEISGASSNNEKILVGIIYREHTKVRGNINEAGSNK